MIFRGSYPEVVLDNKINHNVFYSSYVQTSLERDIRDLIKISDEQAFLKFLIVTASRTASLLNCNDIAQDVGVAPSTVKACLSLLVSSGIVYLLQAYFININKRFIKSPKLCFLDNGLCSYLSAWDSTSTLESGAMSGAIFETYVVTEILNSYWHSATNAFFYFFQDKNKKEIDLIIERNVPLYPLEIKKTANPSKADLKNFTTLEKLGKTIGEGGIICLYKDYLSLSEKYSAIPVGSI